MGLKTYGLDTLAFICAGPIDATDEHGWKKAIHKALLPRYEEDKKYAYYKVRDGGLWRSNSKARGVVAGTPTAERDVCRWQPEAGLTKPALRIPFTAYEFAAFTMAGRGVFIIERFEDEDDEEALSEDALAKLGRDGADAKEVLREAHRLRLEATRHCERNVADSDKPPILQLDDEGTNNAVKWLLNAGREAAAGGVGAPTLEQTTQSHGLEPQAAPAKGEPMTLTTPKIAEAFAFVASLGSALADPNNHQWLIPARKHQGKAPKPSAWCPLKLAEILQGRGTEAESINRQFLNSQWLKPWLPMWQEARRARNAFGQ